MHNYAGEVAIRQPLPSWVSANLSHSFAISVWSASDPNIACAAATISLVSADNGGGSEIVRENINGLLYRPGDVEGLARAIVAMSEPPRRAELAARARTSVAERGVEAMADAYADVFRGMASK